MGVRVKASAVAAIAVAAALAAALLLTTDATAATRATAATACTNGPTLSVTPTSAEQGGSLTVDGSCFAATSTVTFSLTDSAATTITAIATTSTDAAGSFSGTTLTVPANAAVGAGAELDATDTAGGTASAPLTIEACSIPTLTSSPRLAAPGATVTVAAACLAASAPVSFQLEDSAGHDTDPLTTDPATVTTTGGAFSDVTFTVPADAPQGTANIEATDGIHRLTTQILVTACSPAAITVTPGSVAAGGTATVNGSCFPHGTVTVELADSAGTSTQVTATADATGGFSADVTVPTDAATGSASVTASGRDGATATAPLTVTAASTPTCSTDDGAHAAPGDDQAADPAITLSTDSVAAGTSVTVTGEHFPSCAQVLLQLHSDPVSLGGATTDATGAFSRSVVIPAATPAGSHTVSATSGTASASAALTVTASSSASSSTSSPSSSSTPSTSSTVAAGGGAGTPKQPSGALAFTGAHATLIGGVGAALLVLGGYVAWAARRRRLENARWYEL